MKRVPGTLRRLAFGVVMCLSLSVVSWTSEARAQTPPTRQQEEEARAHFQLGRTLYDGGRFEEAAHEFEAAYNLSHRAQLLYNIFLAWRDAAQMDKAITALSEYLRLVPDAQDAESLRSRLASMQRALNEQRAREQAAQQAQADAERARQEATAREAAARAQQQQAQQQQQTQQQQPAPVEATPAPAEDPAPAQQTATQSSSTESSGPGIGPWVLVGAGGAMIIGGIVTGVLANQKMSTLESDCPDNICPADYDLDGAQSSGRALAITTDVLIGVGAAGAVAGVLWYFLAPRSEERAPVSADLSCGTSGCMATANVTF